MNFMSDKGGPLILWKFQLLPFSAQGGTFHPGTASRVVSGIQGLHQHSNETDVLKLFTTKNLNTAECGFMLFPNSWKEGPTVKSAWFEMLHVECQTSTFWNPHTQLHSSIHKIVLHQIYPGVLPSPSRVTASLSFHEDSSKVGQCLDLDLLCGELKQNLLKQKKHEDFGMQHKLQVYSV